VVCAGSGHPDVFTDKELKNAGSRERMWWPFAGSHRRLKGVRNRGTPSARTTNCS
jgi:hypothetical protein